LRTLIARLEQLTGRRAQIKAPQQLPSTEIGQTQASVKKAARMLNWFPEIKLEEGLRRTIVWHLENRAWLDQLEDFK
jgi:nucleoside-diphosphate-sugar epimerase